MPARLPLLRGRHAPARALAVCAQPRQLAQVLPLTRAAPQAKQQLAQLMWLRQSEDLVLEALARLALLGNDLLCMLRP